MIHNTLYYHLTVAKCVWLAKKPIHFPVTAIKLAFWKSFIANWTFCSKHLDL